MGVWDKLLELLSLDDGGLSKLKLKEWICTIWEPAHNINLADGDIRGLDIFDWLINLTSSIGEVTTALGIGKGLEQCFEQAEESGFKFYKIKSFSKTRFAPYLASSYSNFEKNFDITILVLRERMESKDSKVRDTAKKILNNIQNVQSCSLLCGVIDVYSVLSEISCAVQKVEQFPFEMRSKLASGISKLRKMTVCLNLEDSESDTGLSELPTLAKSFKDQKMGSSIIQN